MVSDFHYRGFHICNHHTCLCWSLIYTDPEHQRAKGNLKYFEFQLEKQKKAEQDEPPKETKREERDTTEKKKPKKKKESFQLVPERKKYEMLCRGEGIKMVRQREDTEKWSCLQNIH